MHSPNAHQAHMINNPMMINNPGPRMNGPMGNSMGPHMIQNPNSPMHGIAAPMHSPMNMNSGMPGPMQSSTMAGPMNSPMGGPGPINGPPMNSNPMSQMNMNTPNGPIGWLCKYFIYLLIRAQT